MPPRWIHTLLDLVAFGRELSWIHESKDRHSLRLGPKHREREHPVYQKSKKMLEEGVPFLEILDYMSSVITNEAKRLRARKTEEEVEEYVSYFFHDLIDLLWDTLSKEEREVYEAGIREIWLNPREFSNLFLPETSETYFTSNEYKAQREYVTGLNHYHVSSQKLNDFLTHQKKFRSKSSI